MHLLFVQTGDFRAAAHQLADDGPETYHAQKYSVDLVQRLAARAQVTVLCVKASESYRERLPSGVEVIGAPPGGSWAARMARSRALAAAAAPTHMVLRLPERGLIRWGLEAGVAIFPCLADSFGPRPGVRGAIDRVRFADLGRLLARPQIAWIGNHNLAASRDLVRLGVDAAKIVPWDWPRDPLPEAFEPKTLGPGPHRILALGTVSEEKGVGDLIRAFGATPALARRAQLTVIGRGDVARMERLARRYGVDVHFPGAIPFRDVVPTLRAFDVSVVYSRPTYGEGLPGTIYQSLAARTPLVLSDHRIFTSYFTDGDGTLMAPAADPGALGATLLRLLDDPALYARLSVATAETFHRILLPTRWGDLVEAWIDGDTDWLQRHALPHWSSVRTGAAGRAPLLTGSAG